MPLRLLFSGVRRTAEENVKNEYKRSTVSGEVIVFSSHPLQTQTEHHPLLYHFTLSLTMLFQLLLPSLLAVVAVAVPIADTEEHVEVVRYKRDTILEARDIELADTHGVDLNESKLLRVLIYHLSC